MAESIKESIGQHTISSVEANDGDRKKCSPKVCASPHLEP